MADKQKNIPQALTNLAIMYRERMVECGCDPAEPSDVDRFINGCDIARKIKREIVELSEEE